MLGITASLPTAPATAVPDVDRIASRSRIVMAGFEERVGDDPCIAHEVFISAEVFHACTRATSSEHGFDVSTGDERTVHLDLTSRATSEAIKDVSHEVVRSPDGRLTVGVNGGTRRDGTVSGTPGGLTTAQLRSGRSMRVTIERTP